MQHPRFVSGDFNTGLIAESFPKGFQPESLQHPQHDLLVAVAAAVHRLYRDRAAGIEGQLRGHEIEVGEAMHVLAAQENHAVTVRATPQGFAITTPRTTHVLTLQWAPGQLVAHGTFDGKPFTMQVERVGLRYRLTHYGTQFNALVLDPRVSALQALMPVKQAADMSKFLLSPMPGLLVDVAVQVGQKVQAGERLAAIEAMKMENVLFASADGTVAEVMARKGDSLAVDQAIVRFV
jgi:propionyl-CoA carboxylase alpha chain